VARRVLELHVDRLFYPGGAYQRIRGRSTAAVQVCKSRLTARGAGRYAEATFEGVYKWPNQDDGERSPLCYEGTSLTVESAIGKQSGKIVDLVRFGQLEFTSFQRLQVKVKE
jgi:hypothetical protein